MDFSTLGLFLLAGGASLFMAWVIGAGSSGATPFAPAVGANAISTMQAAFFVGVLGFLGAVLQGGNVTEAVGSGLIRGVSLTPPAVILALVTAAGLMAVGIATGYPIATAFTVTGAIVGAGLALGGLPAWSKYAEIGLMWTVAPLVNAGLAYGLASLLPRDDVPERWSVPGLAGLTGATVSLIGFAMLGPGETSRSIAATAAAFGPVESPTGALAVELSVIVLFALVSALVVRLWIGTDQERGLRRFLLVLGSLVAFSAGGSQVGLAVGPLVPLLDTVEVSLFAVLVGGAVGILVGSWTGAPRMIKSLAQDYASLGPRRSISALLPTFLFAQAAVALGVPISFNQAIVAAIIGSGAAVAGGDGVSRSKMGRTLGAWAGSFLLAFAIGFGTLSLL
ncbi:inorganic phosphate transporter [Halapricum desulfuricans]|uniref:Phosphate transporter n=1 Tax=Halapricum desulfuricans TaxID=2841257 RepID=A0A897N0E1_9EURY|nr:inorganic phosphate transporter [Halapricum desulfuricans]QSG06157.1 Phosphate/sulfate permease [Halapricum desulfuricans]